MMPIRPLVLELWQVLVLTGAVWPAVLQECGCPVWCVPGCVPLPACITYHGLTGNLNSNASKGKHRLLLPLRHHQLD